jgi:outer membrane translocation and assembly module TamA
MRANATSHRDHQRRRGQPVGEVVDQQRYVLTYNTIDDMKNPHQGLYATFGTEVAGLGGDANFVKVTARATYYRTLSEEMDIVGLARRGRRHMSSRSATTASRPSISSRAATA